jgi:hypothetical protein
MTDESASVVTKMLDYLYTGDYSEAFDEKLADDSPKIAPLPLSALQLHAQLFTLGDKYCIPELCDTAAAKYSKRVSNRFDPLEYLDSIPDVFFSPLSHNRDLKELAIRFSRDNLVSRLEDASIRSKYDLIANQVPGFVKEVLDTYLEAPLLGDCENCGYRRPMLPLQARCRNCGRGKGMYENRYG